MANLKRSINTLVREYLEQLVQAKSRKEEARHFLSTTRFHYEPTPIDRDSIYQRESALFRHHQ